MANSLVEVYLPNQDYTSLVSSLSTYERRLRGTQYTLKEREQQLILYKGNEDTLNIVRRYISSEREDLERYNLKINSLKQKIEDYKAYSNLVTLRSIKEELKHHTNITNISLKQKDNGDIFIEYVYHDIKCTPNSSSYLNLIDKSFKLLPIKVRIFLTKNKVYLLPVYGDKAKTTKGYDGSYVVHPHILSNNGRPCLGDFTSSFFESVTDFDISTAATILELFLEQAVTSDEAGKHWPHFMLHNSGLNFYRRYKANRIGDREGNEYHYFGRINIKQGSYWYTIPIVEGGRITMFEGRKEDVLRFFKNYIHI